MKWFVEMHRLGMLCLTKESLWYIVTEISTNKLNSERGCSIDNTTIAKRGVQFVSHSAAHSVSFSLWYVLGG